MLFRLIIIFSFLGCCSVNFAQFCSNPYDLGGPGGDASKSVVRIGQNLLVSGIYQQQILLGGNNYNSAGGSDIFFGAYNNLGQIIFSASIGNAQNNDINAVCADTLGNFYLSGTFSGQLQIGNISINNNLNTSFIAKYSSVGQLQWVKQFQPKGIVHVLDMQVSPDGQYLWVSGDYNDSLVFDNEAVFCGNTYNLYVAKMETSSGNVLWMADAPYAKWAKAKTLTPLPDGSAWVAAEFRDSLQMPGLTYYHSPSHVDILMSQIDVQGNWISHKRWGGVYDDEPKKMRLSPDGNAIWLCGDFVAVLDIDSFRLMTAFRYYDVFWVKMNLEGEAIAVGQTNTIANTYVFDLAFHDDKLWLGGYFQDSLQGVEMHYTNGGFDIYLLGIDTLSATLSISESTGSPGNDQIWGLCSAFASLISTGTFQQQMSWQGTQLSANGFSDAWIGCSSQILNKTESIPKLIEVKIIPNPTNGKFVIELSNYEELQWELFAMNGKVVMSGNTPEIDASKLPKAIYSLRVKNSDGFTFAKIVLKD
jgi:hypothetical protein